MLKQFNKFLIFAILVAAALYVTLTNPETATLKLGPTLHVTTYAGVIYLGVFTLGCVAASMVALFFGFKSYLRERKLRSIERTRQAFFELFVQARCHMASTEFGAARDVLEQILRHDTNNVIARVELSHCLESIGDLREALRVLDETRHSSRRSSEVLFRAAELNRKLGNNTAASDNLALIVAKGPNKRALELIRELSEELGRPDSALEYQNALEKTGYRSEEMTQIKTRLTFANILRESKDEATLRQALPPFIKRYPNYAPALDQLAQLEINLGHLDNAAELLVKAAKAANGDPARWHKVVDLWLNAPQVEVRSRADHALAAARSATQNTRGLFRIKAELFVARTLLAVTRAEDAREVLNSIQTLAEKEGVQLTPELIQEQIHLKGLCLSRLGLIREAAELWQHLVEPAQGSTASKAIPLSSRSAPSPILSTP